MNNKKLLASVNKIKKIDDSSILWFFIGFAGAFVLILVLTLLFVLFFGDISIIFK